MLLLVTGMIFFFGIHMVPLAGGLRQSLQQRMGRRGYLILFSLLSATGLLMMVGGKSYASYQQLYAAPAWGAAIARYAMIPAIVLLVAAYTPCNIRRWFKHPMVIGILLWSLAHLLANGDAASVLLFGGFGLYAIINLASYSVRPAKMHRPAATVNDLLVIIAGVAAYALIYSIHGMLFTPLPY